jgi:hypothetical protein
MSIEEVQLSKKEHKALRKERKAKRKEEKRLEKERRRHLTVTENCKGCGAYMSLDQRFCNECGAKRMYNRLNWRVLFADFTDRFLNVENNFLRTFIDLFKRPQDVIDGYINGVRKKYLSAFSYFAIAVTIAGFSAFILKNWFIDEIVATQAGFFDGSEQADFQKEFQKDWFNMVMDYQSVVYFLSIPLMALISWVVFWNRKKYNLVEHTVIYLYGYSHIAIATVVLGLFFVWFQPIYQVWSFAVLFIQIFYLGYVLKKLFYLDWGGIILKTALFFLVLGVVFVGITLIAVIIGGILIAMGKLDGIEFFEAIKQQEEIKAAMKEAALQVKDSIRRVDSLKLVKEVVVDSIK